MKSAPWFRFYRSAPHKAKVRRLPPVLFKHWVMLLCLTDDDGRLPSLDDTADGMRMNMGRLLAILERLAERHFFEQDGQGWVAHRWDEYQYKSDHSRDRMQASRDRHTDRHGDAPEQNRTEQRQSSDPPSSDQPPNGTPMERFFRAGTVPKRVAALIDLFEAADIGLSRKQIGHLAVLIKRHGHGREVLSAALASFTALGDRIEYMEKVITNGQARQRNTRKGPSVATDDDIAEAKRWQAQRVRRD
jgi:hypothetical protein